MVVANELLGQVKIWTRLTIVLIAQVWSGHHPKLDQATSDLAPAGCGPPFGMRHIPSAKPQATSLTIGDYRTIKDDNERNKYAKRKKRCLR